MTFANIGKMVVSVRAAVAEYVAMTVFITISTGTAVGIASLYAEDPSYTGTDGGFDRGVHCIGTAMAFGFSIVALAYATGHSSGGQMNPAVSIGLLAAGQLPIIQCLVNIVCQVLGAITGSAIVYGMIPGGGSDSTLAGNSIPDGLSSGRAFLGEMMGTFALVFVVLETACNLKSKAGTSAASAIGFTVFIAHLLLIPFTSCSINPARSLGPAIVSGTWGNHFWVFMVAPVVGAIVAAAIHLFFASGFDTVSEETAEDLKQSYQGEMEEMIELIADKLGVPDRETLRLKKNFPNTNIIDAHGGHRSAV